MIYKPEFGIRILNPYPEFGFIEISVVLQDCVLLYRYNAVENAIRPITQGRKIYLFLGNDNGEEDN
jgi:hypothetical protein